MSITWGRTRESNEVVNLLGLLAICLVLWVSTLGALPHKPATTLPLCQPHEHTDMWIEPAPAEPPVVHDYDQTIDVTPDTTATPELPLGPAWDAPHNNVT